MGELHERFLSHIHIDDESGCWFWAGALNGKGYGRFWLNRRAALAHRVSHELFVGPVGDLFVCHKCDNPSCVNPDHFFLGGHKENCDDKMKKGRHVSSPLHGEDHPAAKLSNAQVVQIRTSPLSNRDIAEKFNLAPHYVYRIRKRLIWKNAA